MAMVRDQINDFAKAHNIDNENKVGKSIKLWIK